uniref:Uncharacterized protein n=1 Tax=Meloidogyne enterolobii TaxID=390850 RepID=A0A6V7WDJ2_MELEN|nr:unnamed protein product [Meloidogyne enterolobii]
MEKKKRDCFNCGVKEIKNKWHKYLKEYYLCHTCGDYNQNDTSYNYNIEGFLRQIDINQEKNVFNFEIDYKSENAEELKRKLLINIAKNKIFQHIHHGLEKQVFLLIIF